MFVELEVTIDHVLKQVIYYKVKGETGVFGWVAEQLDTPLFRRDCV